MLNAKSDQESDMHASSTDDSCFLSTMKDYTECNYNISGAATHVASYSVAIASYFTNDHVIYQRITIATIDYV